MSAAAATRQKTLNRALLALATAATLVTALFFTASASAATYGQLSSWGSYGFGSGQFANPVMLGVDSSDGSVFAGDLAKVNATTEDREYVRIQKLSASGTVLGSVQLPRYLNPTTNTKIVTYFGIGVDPVLQRFYVLEGGREKETFGEFVAKRILVFSTVPKEGKLVAPEGGPATIPVPANTLFKPRGIAVDPSNHDLIVMAENKSSPKHTSFQRVSSSGVAGALFSDAANLLRPAGETAAATFAVGPTGTIYAVTGLATAVGKGHTRAFEIPSSFASIQAVPGFAAGIDSEEPTYGFEQPIPSTFVGGPQIAISPDGKTLFWKERILQSNPTTAGNVIVRGFSLADAATTVVYGGGESGQCRIETSGAGLATVGEKLVVFDYGPVEEEKDETPAYGDKVLSFGPGGSGCTAPVAKFKANGVEGNVKVKQGETVSFDASGSELASGPGKTAGFRRELIWDFGDGNKETVKGVGEGEAPATTSHKYTSAGNFTVKLQIRLKKPDFGNPAPAEHAVEAEAGVSEFQLKVTKAGTGSGTVTSSPAGINCGATCEADFAESTVVKLVGAQDEGSKAVVWSGCDSIVGANECQVTMGTAKEVTATFELETAPSKCNGSDIVGEGSSLQFNAHKFVWIPGFQGPGGVCNGVGTEPEVSYLGSGSSAGLNAWDFNGSDGTPFDTSRAFIGSDEAPSAAQIANAESAAGGSKVLIVPVAQTAIGVVVNPPANCEIEEITNKQLESIFRGNIKYWGKVGTTSGSGCAGAPVTRVVRPDGSGTTYQFKDYLSQVNKALLACTTPPGKGWKDLEAIGADGKPNTVWPENGVGGCGSSTVSPLVTAAGSGGANLVAKVNAVSGSIGYAALPDIEGNKSGSTAALGLQNNGLVKLANASFAAPSTEAGNANCSAAKYTVPVAGRAGSGSGENVDWSGVFGANPKIGAEDYPLCALTFAIALKSYGSKAGFGQGQEQTVHDYLTEYVATAQGQSEIVASGQFYSALPSAANPLVDVFGAAQLAASKVGF